MGAVTDVFLITGFLGSGKTTFLNRLTGAFPPDRKLMILMNEFGDVGIDGLLVEGGGSGHPGNQPGIHFLRVRQDGFHQGPYEDCPGYPAGCADHRGDRDGGPR